MRRCKRSVSPGSNGLVAQRLWSPCTFPFCYGGWGCDEEETLPSLPEPSLLRKFKIIITINLLEIETSFIFFLMDRFSGESGSRLSPWFWTNTEYPRHFVCAVPCLFIAFSKLQASPMHSRLYSCQLSLKALPQKPVLFILIIKTGGTRGQSPELIKTPPTTKTYT